MSLSILHLNGRSTSKNYIMIFASKGSDSELIQDILQGGVHRERASKSLLQRHHKLIQRATQTFSLSPQDAQEAYLDSIIAVCRQIEKGKFRGECSISTYLYRIFDNKCKNKLRKKNRHSNQWIEEIPDMPSKARGILEDMIEQEEFDAAEHMLGLLGGKCKQILLLSEYQGYSQGEIAQKLGLKSARVVATSRYRCISKLKNLLRGKQVSLHCELPKEHLRSDT